MTRKNPRWRPVTIPANDMDSVELVGGERLYTHPRSKCEGQTCSVHNPSDHHMATWRQHWRADRGIMERLCPHGVGHPDPDEAAYLKRVLPAEDYKCYGVHGCDGCCKVPS